jgi:hypothetical protein
MIRWGCQIKLQLRSQFMWEIKFRSRSGPFKWNVFSQPIEVKLLKWIFIMFSEVTLVTFFSLLTVGHFTPMGINSSDLFSSHFSFHHQWGHFKWVFFGPLMADHFKWLFFFTPMGVASKDFSCPRVLFFHSFSS